MGRFFGLLLFGVFSALGACSDGGKAPVATAPVDRGATAVEPRIVVQIGHQAPVQAVQWVDGGRHLLSLARDGSVVVWSVATGTILDHAQVPAAALADDDGAGLSFRRLLPVADGKSLQILYAVKPGSEAACPAKARAGKGWCGFSLDLASRTVRPDGKVARLAPPGGDDAAGNFPLSPDRALRPEPNHADGRRGGFDQTDDHLQFEDPTCVSLRRCRYGVSLFPVTGTAAPIRLTGNPRSYFLDGDLSADGRHLVRVEGLMNDTRARVETLDLASGTAGSAFQPDRAYHRVGWLGAARYALFSEGYAATNDTPEAMAGFPPALVVDPACVAAAGRCAAVDSHWQMEPLDDAGSFIAIGSLAGCYRTRTRDMFCPGGDGEESRDPPGDALALHKAGEAGWRPLAPAEWEGQTITAIQLSPDRRRLAVATRTWDNADALEAKQILHLWMLDLADGTAAAPPRELLTLVGSIADARTEHGRGFSDRQTIRALSFTADGSRLVFAQTMNDRAAAADLYVVDADVGQVVRKLPRFSRRVVAVGNQRVFGLDNQKLVDIETGRPVARALGRTPLVRAGWIERSDLLWAATDDGAIRFWGGADGALQMTLYMFPGNRFFAVTPGGRYDTNLGPDTDLIRWLVPDAPWQSLAAQTFMRDFYEPGLYGKLLDCRAGGDCGAVFRPLPAIATLNRVMPQVRIAGVVQGKAADEAVVTLEVREGVDSGAANGKTRSGVYNPRLFRNGRVVAMLPDRPDPTDEAVADWRTRNAMGSAARRLSFTVPLPTGDDGAAQIFSAYAFNEDRIKSETASFTYAPPPAAPRERRAYVVAIGIDDYDTPRFRLNYSVADARLIAARLADVPGYRMHRLTLAGERGAGGRRARIDAATIGRVLSLLQPGGDRAATLKALKAAGIDAATLEPATPDDLVIISFSGHGWADPRGNFYLVPTNGRWPDGATAPDRASLFATADLARHFQGMSAADITLIIDACHSAASVANGRFKPGPMGDSGLGQLAFDKGVRILAATQADDVAMEDGRLQQGLLTYALVAEGLSDTGGKADLDGDGRIRLDEWLTYAVQRLPSLSEDARVGRIGPAEAGTRAITFHDLPAAAPRRRLQQPSLFDFNAQPSPVVLRRIGG